MNDAFPSILTLGTFDSKISIAYRSLTKTAPRTVLHYELEYFSADGGVTVLNGVPYKITKGNILLAKPGDIRYSHFPLICRFVHFNIDNEELARSLDGVKPFSPVSERGKTEDFFRTVSSLFRSGNKIDSMAASAELLLLLRELSIEHSRDMNIISFARQFIENNYHTELSTDSIAAECSVSVSYLHQMFRKKN